MGSRVSEIGEFELIARLAGLLGGPFPKDTVGIGDDGAIFPLPVMGSAGRLVVTTDTMIEGHHFRRDFSSFEELGAKLMAVNLSDLAAMGAAPFGATVSLQIPEDFLVEDVELLYRGMKQMAEGSKLQILGGDTVQSPVCAFGVTAFGFTVNPLLRSTARDGDDVWVSGPIGGGGLGLALCRGEIDPASLEDCGAAGLARYRTPTPQTELGKQLSQLHLATSAIDVSDGLLQDLGHIARLSDVDIVVSLLTLPLVVGCRSPLEAAIAGDDYELAFTARTGERAQIEAMDAGRTGLTRIGTVVPKVGAVGAVWLELEHGAAPIGVGQALAAVGLSERVGYQHFRGQ